MPHDKQRIARAFSAAAPHYDQAAGIQRETGRLLLARIGQAFSDGLRGQTVLDIGAGSGHFSRILQQSGAQVCAVDLAEGMLRHIRAQTEGFPCVLADAEALPFADGTADLCFSSLAVQWCKLSAALNEMWRITRPGGFIAVSTLADGSLAQLKQAWQAADSAPHVNPFLSVNDIRDVCAPFQAEIRTHTLQERFPDLHGLLHSLKTIGANHVGGRQNGLTGKTRWQRFTAAYETLRLSDGSYPLDYQIVLIFIRKTGRQAV